MADSDTGDYAMAGLENDWSAFAVGVIGVVVLICAPLLVKKFHRKRDPIYEDIFPSDPLERSGEDATSTLLRPSSTTGPFTHTITETITQTVFVAPNPDEVASQMLGQVQPAMSSQVLSLESRQATRQDEQLLYITLGILLFVILALLSGFLFIYQLVRKQFLNQHDRPCGGHPPYISISTQTMDLQQHQSTGTEAAYKSVSTETTDLQHDQDNNGHPAYRSIITEPAAPKPASEETVQLKELVDSGESQTGEEIDQGEVSPSGTSPRAELPITPISSSETTTHDDATPPPADSNVSESVDGKNDNINAAEPSQEDAAPSPGDDKDSTNTAETNADERPAQPDREDLTSCPAGGKGCTNFVLVSEDRKRPDAKINPQAFTPVNFGAVENQQLDGLLGDYADWIRIHFLNRMTSGEDQKARDELVRSMVAIQEWIKKPQSAEGIHPPKKGSTRRKFLENQLHEHFQTIQEPTNVATVRNYTVYVENALSNLNSKEREHFEHELEWIENMIPTSRISIMDKAIKAHKEEMEAALTSK